ncbi:MAG: hypothetical protein U9P72_03170 [Campylobacterota bacterium]|nr:hypothetical protein [Campylobacterota bacterium]
MKKSLLSLVAVTALSTTMFASDVRVSGFASVVGGYIDNAEVGARTNAEEPGFGGYTSESVEFQPDSFAGIQFSKSVTDDMSATVQMVARFEDEDAKVGLEWAYINYNLSEDLTLQAGRFLPDMLLYSNTLNIGYSYLWIAPPTETYTMTFMRYVDGANLIYSHEFDNEMVLSSSAYFANTNQKAKTALGETRDFEYKDIWGISAQLSNEYVKLRAGVHGRSVTINGIDWTDGSSRTPTQADHIAFDDSKAIFTNVALSVDYEDIILISEYTVKNIEDTVSVDESTAYYATLGYRMGKFTPHVTYSVLESEPEYIDDSKVDAARSIKAIDSETIAVGLRYDLNMYSALKFEYQNNSVTPHDKKDSTNQVQTDANLYKIALNIAF